MSYANTHSALRQYGKVSVNAEIAYASPHRLVQMLMEGALEKISIAKGAVGRGDLAARAKHIGWSISIINCLRSALDMKAGGEIAANLNDLYDYMVRRLAIVNVNSDVRVLDEVSGLLGQIKSAWDAIPEDVKNLRRAAGG